ncbi:Ac81-like protein [Aratus pisonii nudivirus]|nr:Ac81-like protein [Aratus pisonii nudivirus]
MENIVTENKKYVVNVYTKYINNNFGLFVHNYLSIPYLQLEIHPGRFRFGSHHSLGKFKKNSYCNKSMLFCKDCLNLLLIQSRDMENLWWFPIMNCETLTRGLTQHLPISYQTIIITGIFTTFIIGIQEPYFFILTFILIVMLVLYNNNNFKMLKDTCVHL